MIGRTAISPLPDPISTRLEPSLARVGIAFTTYLRAIGAALQFGRHPPPLADMELAFDAFAAEVATVRREGLTQNLPDDAAERFFALGAIRFACTWFGLLLRAQRSTSPHRRGRFCVRPSRRTVATSAAKASNAQFHVSERRRMPTELQRGADCAQVGGEGYADPCQGRFEPRTDGIGQRTDRRSADHDQVVSQPKQRAQQWSRVGARSKTCRPLMLGLGAHYVQVDQRPSRSRPECGAASRCRDRATSPQAARPEHAPSDQAFE